MISPQGYEAFSGPWMRRVVDVCHRLEIKCIYNFSGNPAGKLDAIISVGADALGVEEINERRGILGRKLEALFEDTKPDAVWYPLWGADAVNFIKQALPTGIFDSIAFASPCAGALEVLVPMGKDIPEDIYVSSRYFFTSPESSMNHRFLKAYYEKYKEYPDYMAGETYAGVYFIKAAVERAGSTDSETIIKAVEREPLSRETPEGWKIMRGADHSVVEDCLWGQTTFNKKYGFSIPSNFVSINV